MLQLARVLGKSGEDGEAPQRYPETLKTYHETIFSIISLFECLMASKVVLSKESVDDSQH